MLMLTRSCVRKSLISIVCHLQDVSSKKINVKVILGVPSLLTNKGVFVTSGLLHLPANQVAG